VCNARSTLKHSDAIFATYKRRQMKYLEHASETLAKTFEKHLKNHSKHMQHANRTPATYV
jgi:hypothetical protein